MEVPLGVAGLAGEFTSKVNQPRPAGTHGTGQAGFLHSLVPLITVTLSGVETDVKPAASLLILILGMLEWWKRHIHFKKTTIYLHHHEV